jgi:hypothetical protein
MADERSDWDQLIENSYRYAEDRQAELEKDFDISKQERFDFNEETGTLIFSNDGEPALIAEVQFVGSYSSETGTWLWAWADSSIEPKLYEKLGRVYDFGEERNFPKLTDPEWEAERADGWQMAAIAAYLLKAKGLYRPPFDKGYFFMVITNIDWAQ